MVKTYRLWTPAWCDYELTTKKEYLPAIRSLFAPDWPDNSQALTLEVELIPEPYGSRGAWDISVRAQGRTLGRIGEADAPTWAGVIRRIVASGFIPTTTSRIWANEYDGWDGIEFNAYVRIALGDPSDALPINQPPQVPYTMLPRSSIVQVTKEEEYFDTLAKFVPRSGHGTVFVTLHEHASTGRAKPYVEVRIDDEPIGRLTPQMSQRFLPMVRHLRDRGLITACWGDINGSTVAAEVRIDGVKANEATQELLEGPPVTIPPLVPELSDPLGYDLTAMRSVLESPPLVRPALPQTPAEPPDGSLVRFNKGGGRYHYVAVRRGDRWETTATADWGSINEIMIWKDLTSRVRKFEIATAWAPVDVRWDSRVNEKLAVVRFTIGGLYLAAINISDDGNHGGDWYTTITDDAEPCLPFGDHADWSSICRYGQHIQVVTAWAPLT